MLRLIFVLGGLYYGWTGIALVRELRRVRRWQRTEGRVLDADVVERVIGRGRIGVSRVYMPRVKYCYQVEGREYVSDALNRSGWLRPSRRSAERVLEALRPGRAVTVHYDPGTPQQACLRVPELAAWPYLLGSLALFVLAFWR